MSQYKRIVLLRFSPQTAREEIAAIFEALDELRDEVPGIVDMASGPYDSAEGLHKGFTHAFVMTFADLPSRDNFLEHPSQENVKQMIVRNLAGGLADLVAFDFEDSDRFRY